MRFECPNCHKVYEVPDEKLPAGRRVAFPCLKCQHRILLDLRGETWVAAGADDARPAREDEAQAQASVADEGQPLSGEALKERLLKEMDELPPMPQIIFKAYEIMENPDSNTKQVADLIESDQAIAARVLKIANSAYYGMSGKVSSVQHASVVLGFKALTQLITMAGTATLMSRKLYGYNLEAAELWRHSMAVAFGAKFITAKRQPARENDAFSAGLIHDVGKIVLDRAIFNRKPLFDEFMESGERTFLSAERRILGFDHAEIGFDICRQWRIPERLTTAIRYHHAPEESAGNELAYVIAMADTIAKMAASISMVGEAAPGVEALMYMVDDDTMAHLGLEQAHVERLLVEVAEAVNQLAGQMGAD
jgi:predicted Zn finger-like uncharacterized protein